MTSLVPAASDGIDIPESLDDLLPSTTTQERGQQPAAEPPPAPATPEPPRAPTQADIDEIAALHDEVNQASEAAERSPFGGKGRKRLKAALRAEDDALRALGFASHAEFVFATGAGSLPPPQDDDFWGPDPRSPRETLANINTLAPELAPDPVPDVADEPAPSTAELELARSELARAHAEVQRVQDELDAANAARRASDEVQAQTRAQLDELTAWRVQADTAADAARRQLADAEAELVRIRAELAAATTAATTAAAAAAATVPVSDESALEQIRQESEAELARIRALAASEIEDLAAQLSAYETEASRVAAEHQQSHQAEFERFEGELRAAGDATARAEAEAADATRSRDAAIDELARHRAEIDALRSEVGSARADVSRWEDACAAAMVRVSEAEAALSAARDDSDRDVVRLDALAKQQEAELAELRAQLGQASTDANALAIVQTDLAKAHDDLEIAMRERAESAAAVEELRADLNAARAELETTRTDAATTRADADAARADADSARAEIEAVCAELATLETTVDELKAAAAAPAPEPEPEPEPATTTVPPAPEPTADPEPTEELRRLVSVAKEMADGTDHRPHSRVSAERERVDLESSLEELRAKRRRAKQRLERERVQLREEREALEREVREAEAARDRIRYETEAIAARVASEAAAVLDDALRQRRAEERARDAEIEQAGAALAALEAGVETVAVGADALRSKLALIRHNLLVAGEPAPPIGNAPRPGGHD